MTQYLNTVVFLFLVGVVFVNRIATKTWFSPSSIFSVFWSALLVVAIFIVPYELQTSSVIVLVSFVVCFSAPSWLLADYADGKRHDEGVLVKSQPQVFLTLFLVVSGIVLMHFYMQGFSLIDFIRDPAGVAGGMLRLRYSKELNSNIFTALMYPLMYGLAALGGRQAIADQNRSAYFYLFLSLAPAFSLVIFQSSKGAVLVSIFIFFGALLASQTSTKLKTKIFTPRNALIFLCLIGSFLFSFYSRGLSDSSLDYVMWKLQSYLLSYSVGSVFGFSDWFAFYLGDPSINSFEVGIINTGKYSFYPLVEQPVVGPAIPNELYYEYATWGGFLKTNIYTFYRGLVLDFGVVGALILMVLFGGLFHLGYLWLRSNPASVRGWSIYVFFFVFCYQSYIASPFNYLSYYVFVALLVLLGYVNKIRV